MTDQDHDAGRRGRRFFGGKRRDPGVGPAIAGSITPADDQPDGVSSTILTSEDRSEPEPSTGPPTDPSTPAPPAAPSTPSQASAPPAAPRPAVAAVPEATSPDLPQPEPSGAREGSHSVESSTVEGSGPVEHADEATVEDPVPSGSVAAPVEPPPIAGGAAPPIEAPTPEAPPAGSDDSAPEPFELPRVIAIANQKGGVGKTTTAVNLGASLAELGYRVLVVDLDPQGNATTGLGINARNLQASIYDILMNDVAIEDCIEPTSLRNLFVAPATIDLAGAEIELVPAFSRELKLRRAIAEVRDEYDWVLIDCPPSLGLLTVNGLAAADDVIVPIQCEYYALEGLSQLIRNVHLVRSNLNPSLDVRGIVLTMYDARTKLADQVEQEVRQHFGRRVYNTVVPRNVRISEAPSFGQPVIVFDSTSRGSIAYRELAKEVSSGASRRSG